MAAWTELQVRAQVLGTGLRVGASPLHISFQHNQPMLRSLQKQKALGPVSEGARVLFLELPQSRLLSSERQSDSPSFTNVRSTARLGI